MTPSTQEAESVKYVCTQFCFVPHEDDTISIFTSYGANRILTATIPSAELVTWLKEEYSHQRSLHEKRKKHAARIATAVPSFDLNLDIDFKLDL